MNDISSEDRTAAACVITFGCQMNVRDSQKIEAMLAKMGYSISDAYDSDVVYDMVVINTCCVRASAENKAKGHIGKLKWLKKRNPNAVIAVCGCMPQQETVALRIASTYKHVDIILGTFNLSRLPALLDEHRKTGKTVIDIRGENDPFDPELPARADGSCKAYINIMYGCDNFCSYCIVPYVRGRERSRRYQDILGEVKGLIESGVKEITLLGQNVNSYGRGLSATGGERSSGDVTFAQLLHMINDIPGLERLRFVTSHPKDLSDELIYAVKTCDKVCPHLHLPVQSGSSRILKLMNRGYGKEQYLELLAKLREAVPDIAISTDIIVGFPTETEEDFEDTLDIVEKARYSQAFTFIYAKRDGTPAAKMSDNVSKEEIKERFGRLQERVNRIAFEINSGHVNKKIPVLIEGKDEKTGLYYGRTPGNTLTHICRERENSPCIGEIEDVLITSVKTFFLIGRM